MFIPFLLSNLIIFSISKVVYSTSPDWHKTCESIKTRKDWGSRIAVAVDYAIVPVKYVIIHHTVTPECETEFNCASTVRGIQEFHMDTLEFHDIGYNFLVGGDGNVYEGASWHKVGAHTRGYNSRSMGLAFIGNFSRNNPNNKQLEAAIRFLKCAVELGELDENYVLFGARQVSATASPGNQLFNEIKTWKHFTNSP